MAELGTAAEVAEDAGRWWGEAGEWDGGAEGGIAGGGRGEAANGGGGDAARMRGQGMGNERTLAGGGRGRWFQFILWVLPTRSSLSNPVGRSVGRPAALLFLSLPPTRANVLLLPPTLPSRVPFVFPPRGFYCSPCFFQGHFSSIFLSSFEEEEFPSFFSPPSLS